MKAVNDVKMKREHVYSPRWPFENSVCCCGMARVYCERETRRRQDARRLRNRIAAAFERRARRWEYYR